ncbi:hypothetical protein CRG98_007534 [Punica granatum]|uniref:Uncharacterized protein n=1 Tax=Punica granatum TaxID=22663 RepID=A0A2I0KUC0_PUNGR|nr:hypothetical protein CRG98_007534 [Punica granatum]
MAHCTVKIAGFLDSSRLVMKRSTAKPRDSPSSRLTSSPCLGMRCNTMKIKGLSSSRLAMGHTMEIVGLLVSCRLVSPRHGTWYGDIAQNTNQRVHLLHNQYGDGNSGTPRLVSSSLTSSWNVVRGHRTKHQSKEDSSSGMREEKEAQSPCSRPHIEVKPEGPGDSTKTPLTRPSCTSPHSSFYIGSSPNVPVVPR